MEEEVVQVIAQKYKRQFKKFQHWNMLLGILVCGLAFVSMGIFMIAWTVWLIEYIGGIYWFVYGTHQKMYQLKVERGWIVEETKQTIYIDTEVSAYSDKMPLPKKWYIPIIFVDCCDDAISSDEKISKRRCNWLCAVWNCGWNEFVFLHFSLVGGTKTECSI